MPPTRARPRAVTCIPRSLVRGKHGRPCDADYKGFLLRCYLVGVKVPNDSAFHLLPDVHWNKVSKWCQQIQLACATAEYSNSISMTFEEGLMEFDTALTSVDRDPSAQSVARAREKRGNPYCFLLTRL